MRYVAFLRGINVGGRTIKMTDLKTNFEAAGFTDVKTILASGNVIFSGAKNPAQLKSEIEVSLTKAFEYPAKVQIFSLDKLRKIVDEYPFNDNDPEFQNYIIFFENGLENELGDDMIGNNNADEIKPKTGVMYWRVAKGQTLESPLAKLLTKPKFKTFNTNRNLNTLRKILAAA